MLNSSPIEAKLDFIFDAFSILTNKFGVPSSGYLSLISSELINTVPKVESKTPLKQLSLLNFGKNFGSNLAWRAVSLLIIVAHILNKFVS